MERADVHRPRLEPYVISAAALGCLLMELKGDTEKGMQVAGWAGGQTAVAIFAISHLREKGAVCSVKQGGEKRLLCEGGPWTKTCGRGRQ